MNLVTPSILKAEHEELHAELARATKAGGTTGEAARAVAGTLDPHFLKEEEFAMPPLALLVDPAAGNITGDATEALRMTDRLKKGLPEMLSEHKAIVAALEKLSEAARAEHHPEFVEFSEKLVLHARTEEQILYPAAILVGDYLKLKLR